MFDIDGVLADVRHRLHLLSRRPKRWDAFFSSAPQDDVLPEGLALVRLTLDEGVPLVYSTGRPERLPIGHPEWFERHGFPQAPLYMRSDRDHRPGRVTSWRSPGRARRAGAAGRRRRPGRRAAALRRDGFEVIHAMWMGSADFPADHVDEARQLLFDLQEHGEL